jgi:hypothetical protein
VAFFTAMSRPPASEVAETGGAVHGDQAIETVRRFVGRRHQKRRHPRVALPRCLGG